MKCMLIKYASEITLKGLNRRSFEDALVRNVRSSIGGHAVIKRESGRLFVNDYSDEMVEKAAKVFGVISVTVAEIVEKDIEMIGRAAVEQLKSQTGHKTFKVETKRGDKRFPLGSMEVSAKVGGVILRELPELKVDVHKPEIVVNVEIREQAYVFTGERKGVGGMPYKSSGKGILLLSGGIDSPVAGFTMAKRGLELISVYYHSHPYTSERAKEKVVELAKILTQYTGFMRLYVVPFTEIQMAIIENCREDELTIIMRRFMMKVAEVIAEKEGAMCLVTGESLGQVASQTLESIFVTNSELAMPVFRPLIGMDKIDIIDISRRIGTYDTSILPYEDCCTVFVPKHPKTRPRLSEIKRSEEVLPAEQLIRNAVLGAEILNFKL